MACYAGDNSDSDITEACGDVGFSDSTSSSSTTTDGGTSTGPSTPTTTGTIAINNQSAQQVAKAAGGSTKVGYALYDSSGNLLGSYNDTSQNYSASISKAMILVAYLNQIGSGAISDSAKLNLTAMIEQSDDAASNRVYHLLTNPVVQINAVASAAGMSGFKIDTSDPLYVLGQSDITAGDFAKFFSKIDTMFPAAQKNFAMNLLANINQQVGLLQAGLPGTVYSKEGWKPEPDKTNPFGNQGSPWVVNQAAQFSASGTTYGLAVTVSGANSQTAGEALIKKVVAALIGTQ